MPVSASAGPRVSRRAAPRGRFGMTTGLHGRRADDRRGGSRRVELLGLLLLSKRLLGAADPRGAADALLDSVVALYGFPRAVLVNARGDRLTVFAAHGLTVGAPLGPEASPAVSQAAVDSATRLLRGWTRPASRGWPSCSPRTWTCWSSRWLRVTGGRGTARAAALAAPAALAKCRRGAVGVGRLGGCPGLAGLVADGAGGADGRDRRPDQHREPHSVHCRPGARAGPQQP